MCYRCSILSLAIVLAASFSPSTAQPPSSPKQSSEPRETVGLDAVLETTEGWSPDTDRFRLEIQDEHTHETPRAIRFDMPTDLGPFEEDLFTQPQGPGRWFLMPDDLDLRRYSRLTVWAKMTGRRAAFIHIGLSSQTNFWGKNIVCVYNSEPIDRGPWRRYTLNFHHLTPEQRGALRYLIVRGICVGHQPDEDPVTRIVLDDWRLSDPPQRKFRGWGADPDVVTVSQAGFRRFSEKIALVPARCEATDFVVQDTQASQAAYRGGIEPIAGPLGSYKLARFDEFTKPGRYRVVAGKFRSVAFRIDDRVFDEPLHFAYSWLRDMRCGCATRRHMPCHLDDALWDGKHYDVSGGWHDAGDVRTYWYHSARVPLTALRLYGLGHRHDDDGDGRDDFLDDAAWGAAHLVKVYEALGWFPMKIRDWPDYRRGNYWTDNVVGTPDDRYVIEEPFDLDTEADLMAAAAMFASRHPADRQTLARRLLEIAQERFDHLWHPETGKEKWKGEKPRAYHGYHTAHWVRGMLGLYQSTGDRRYLEPLTYYARSIVACQRRSWPEGATRPWCGEIFSWMRRCRDRDLPEEALALLCEALPEHPDWHQWHFALVRGIEHWHKPVRRLWQPFSVPQLEQRQGDARPGGRRYPFEVGSDTDVLVRDQDDRPYVAVRSLGDGAVILLGWDFSAGHDYLRDLLLASLNHARRTRGLESGRPIRTRIWTGRLRVPREETLHAWLVHDGGRRIGWGTSMGTYHNLWRSLYRQGEGKAFPVTNTNTEDPAELANQLKSTDVLIVPWQDRARGEELVAIGKKLAPAITEFVRNGGVVLATTGPPPGVSLIPSAGLIDFEPVEPARSLRTIYRRAETEHPLAEDLPLVVSVQQSEGVQIVDGGPDSLYAVPFAGAHELPGTAASLMKVARALNDPELERTLTWQVQWVLGHNPLNLSFMVDYGEDCITQAYSFSQGRLPGALTTTFGMDESGVPEHIRPTAGEIWVTSGRKYIEALGEIAAPAKLRMRLLDGGKPFDKEAIVYWPRGNQPVGKFTCNGEGHLPPIELSGGETYELRVKHDAGEFRLPLPVVSGTEYRQTVDLGGHLLFSKTQSPHNVAPGQAFSICVTVTNLGHSPTSAQVDAFSADCRIEGPSSQAVTVPGRQSRTLNWKLVAGEARHPYIFRAELDGDHARGIDATGTIGWRLPKSQSTK